MKKSFLFIAAIFCIISALSQTRSFYLDAEQKPASAENGRFLVQVKYTDSGWQRNSFYLPSGKMKETGLFTDSNCITKHGMFYSFHPNGVPAYIGSYINNRKNGIWLSYHENKFMRDSTVYANDKPTGMSLSWHDTGIISDSTVYAPNGSSVSIEWFDNGSVSSAGRFNANGDRHGVWNFFHDNGQVSAREIYDNGYMSSARYFDEKGNPMESPLPTRGADFPGGVEAWMKFLDKKLYWPPNYKIVNSDRATVGVQFIVNQKGKITNIYIHTPFDKAFNDIIMRVLKNSPDWEPALYHNRRVMYLHKQSITFRQEQ
jgi:antitoxin component YwqK of YwqJK toxin-antitoxin module